MVATRRKVARTRCWRRSGRSRSTDRAGSKSPTSFPTSSRCADDLAVVRSCWADSVNHPQAVYQINTGSILMGKPVPGELGRATAWGRRTRTCRRSWSCPTPAAGSRGGPRPTGPGFLPASHQGTLMRGGDSPILDLKPPGSTSPGEQRRSPRPGRPAQRPSPGNAGRRRRARRAIQSYELAFRMQSAAPEAVELSRESAESKSLYGLDDPPDRRVRHPLPAGPPPGRARRPLRAALLGRHRRAGTPTTTSRRTTAPCAPGPTSRSPDCSPT